MDQGELLFMPVWLEVIARTLLAVVTLFFLTRLLGKRQITQLSLFEYITGITIGGIAAYISLDLDAAWYLGLISLAVWVGVSYGIEYLQLKSKKLRDFLDSKGTVLMREGKILEENLKKERLTSDELLEQLRMKGVFNLAEVEFVIIEPSGDINVLLTKENQPITPKYLERKVESGRAPQSVIMDGKIMDEPLAATGLSRRWLYKELESKGIMIDNVYVGQVDSDNKLYIDLYDDRLQ